MDLQFFEQLTPKHSCFSHSARYEKLIPRLKKFMPGYDWWGSGKCQNWKVSELESVRITFFPNWKVSKIFRTAYSLNIAVSVTVLGMRSSYLGWRISCQGKIDGGVESVRTGKCQNWKVSESLFSQIGRRARVLGFTPVLEEPAALDGLAFGLGGMVNGVSGTMPGTENG